MKMTQMDKVLSFLVRNGTKGKGVTTAKIAHEARVPKESVSKRIYDLRNEGLQIYTNTRKVNGETKSYYKLAI